MNSYSHTSDDRRRSLDEALFGGADVCSSEVAETFVAQLQEVHPTPPPPPPPPEIPSHSVRDGGYEYMLANLAPGVFEMREVTATPPRTPPPTRDREEEPPPNSEPPSATDTVPNYSFEDDVEAEPRYFFPDSPVQEEISTHDEESVPEPTPEPVLPVPLISSPPHPACVEINEGLTLDAGKEVVIGPRWLRICGPTEAVELIILSSVAHGVLTLAGVELAAGDVVTQEDINAGKLHYRHVGDATEDHFFFGTPDGEVPPTRFVLTIRPVRRAPDLLGKGRLDGVLLGCRVAEILEGQLRCHDGVPGLVVVGVGGSGTWQFSLDGMRSWRDFPSVVHHGEALPLRENDVLRFVPRHGWSGTVRLAYRAWDGSTGKAGEPVNLSDRGAIGGNTAFSRDSETATLRVSAPVPLSIVEPWDNEPTVGELMGGGLAVVRAEGPGVWQYSLDDGLTWLDFGAVYHGRARLLGATNRVRFLPRKDGAGQVVFAGKLWDGRGAVGDTANLSPRASFGEGTPFGDSVQTRRWRIAE